MHDAVVVLVRRRLCHGLFLLLLIIRRGSVSVRMVMTLFIAATLISTTFIIPATHNVAIVVAVVVVIN